VDELNLRYGVVHGDLHYGNVLIDQSTNQLRVFDFGNSKLMGPDHYRRHGTFNKDVQGVILIAWWMVTRNEDYDRRQLWGDLTELEDVATWEQAADANLSHEPEEFYRFMIDWAEKRRSAKPMKDYTEALEPLEERMDGKMFDLERIGPLR